MSSDNRIKNIQNRIAISEHSLRVYREDLDRTVDAYLESIKTLDETTKSFIMVRDEEFLSDKFIAGIKDLSYDELQLVVARLNNLVTSILDEIESNIK